VEIRIVCTGYPSFLRVSRIPLSTNSVSFTWTSNFERSSLMNEVMVRTLGFWSVATLNDDNPRTKSEVHNNKKGILVEGNTTDSFIFITNAPIKGNVTA
jgi:hypothetical protein